MAERFVPRIEIPEFCLVVLIGASGSGKSTFARRHFKPTEILSSDYFRGLVCDDEGSQEASKDAFDALRYVVEKRLRRMRLTVIDATNVRAEDRKQFAELARAYHCFLVGIVIDMPPELCLERNAARPDRAFGPHVVRGHVRALRHSLRFLEREGFRNFHVIRSPEQAAEVEIVRTKSWNNRRDEHGPFDIIGDIHGCATELETLLAGLGYTAPEFKHPDGRKAVFVGDLVDRGPRILDTVRIVRCMVESGSALCVPGNHDIKLLRALRGKNVKIAHGLEQSLAEAAHLTDEEKASVCRFLDGLISHYVLDDGKLVVAHAGLKEDMQGRMSGAVREFCLYGETTGETDEFGLPIRYNWAAEYRGEAMVVYGHTPVPQPEWLNNTINIDTGCVFGGKLTALRYPEKQLVSVPALAQYAEPIRPLIAAGSALSAQQEHDDLLDLEDVLGKRAVEVEDGRRILVREENARAALEVMSRFACDPRWLIYLPPTMSPCETSQRPDALEYPEEAFRYYASQGVEEVVCQEKHMGSRAVVIVGRDADAARQRFGVREGATGICYTRTGRPFFEDRDLEERFLARVREALDQADFWSRHETDWAALDCELMPWNSKAQELLRRQYAAVGVAGERSLDNAASALAQAALRGVPVAELRERTRNRAAMLSQYRESYRRYCWSVKTLDDYRLAPFHVLATEGRVHFDKPHTWHMEEIARCCGGPLLFATRTIQVRTSDEASIAGGAAWWEELTKNGGEGMVVKPLDFVARGPKGLVQPAVKCRGAEYLRIIYGPEYLAPGQLERLRARSLGSKRSLAQREFLLGWEGLKRFVAHAPLRQVHECVFAVLAMESEPVDPRL